MSPFRAGRDGVVLDALPGLTLGLAVLQSVLAVLHGTLGAERERSFFFLDAATAAFAATIYFTIRKGGLSERWAHPFAAGCSAFAAVIVLVHLRVLGDPLQGLMLALVLLGSGSLFLSHGWLNLVAGGSLLGWAAVAWSLGPPPGSLRLGIALLGSWAVATMILSARLRSFVRLEELRAENEVRLIGDVLKARRTAESLRQSEESHRLLFEKSPLPMWLVSRDSLGFLAVNDAAVRHYGFSRAEFLEMTLEDVHPREDVSQLLADFTGPGSEEGEAVITRRHRTKEGSVIDVEIVAHATSFGEWNAVLAVMTDTTERRRAAEERERIIAELKEALANVKTLRGLVPICASCKKIRDDKGYWSQVEVYVRDHTEAEFSHGICPECSKKLYGK